MPGDVRFGLVGYGLFGAHHARVIESTPGAQLVAIAAKSDRSRLVARQTHAQATIFEDYAALVQSDEVDVVDIVAPNALHYEMARAALLEGKHVLLEKPMALEVRHCDELIALADARQRVLAVNHELRLSSLWGGAKALIDKGAIGEPLYALIELARFPYRRGSEGWRYDMAQVGNWILEEPIHFFDLARWYMSSRGEPTSLYARANGRRVAQPALQDNFSAMVNFPGEAYAVVSQTLAAFGHHVTAKIAGAEGLIWAWWSAADARSDKPQFGLRWGLGETVQELHFDKPTGELLELADQIAAMVRAVRDGAALPCTGHDGRWSTRLCLAAQQSVETGSSVALAAAEGFDAS